MSAGRLAGRYSLLRPLGAGGMGKVWLARDEMLERDVAVKELTLPEGMPDKERSEAVTRAVREAQATARLRHPGIVALHDVVVEQDRPWLVMELLRGRTLGDTVRDFGPMPPDYAARVGADVLEALMVAHAQGLQHRDVKPGNVFLTESGRVVLTDFGIARQEGQATLTEQGLMIGSPGFIAPERLEGHPGGPASDLWSLGATLYVALTGAPAYSGSMADRVRATLTQPVPVAPGPLGPVVAAMMAQHPGARPDPRLVVDALRQVAAGLPAPKLPAGEMATAPSGSGGRGKLGVLVAAVVVVALAAAATTGFLLLRDRDGAAASAFTTPHGRLHADRRAGPRRHPEDRQPAQGAARLRRRGPGVRLPALGGEDRREPAGAEGLRHRRSVVDDRGVGAQAVPEPEAHLGQERHDQLDLAGDRRGGQPAGHPHPGARRQGSRRGGVRLRAAGPRRPYALRLRLLPAGQPRRERLVHHAQRPADRRPDHAVGAESRAGERADVARWRVTSTSWRAATG
ncbi:serine/threonine-protein kinase [Nonomuraea salmonea]|uniref:serine/threonine-protein kinase n=1 Tax=Nonomuraea salmonea TaxID=46181 RepID=UPI0031E615E3